MAGSLYEQWARAFQSVGACHISLDTCARLMAVLYVYGGGDERFIYNDKALTDIKAAQERLSLVGGEVPDKDGVRLMQEYIKKFQPVKGKEGWQPELEAREFIKSRYGFELRS